MTEWKRDRTEEIQTGQHDALVVDGGAERALVVDVAQAQQLVLQGQFLVRGHDVVLEAIRSHELTERGKTHERMSP